MFTPKSEPERHSHDLQSEESSDSEQDDCIDSDAPEQGIRVDVAQDPDVLHYFLAGAANTTNKENDPRMQQNDLAEVPECDLSEMLSDALDHSVTSHHKNLGTQRGGQNLRWYGSEDIFDDAALINPGKEDNPVNEDPGEVRAHENNQDFEDRGWSPKSDERKQHFQTFQKHVTAQLFARQTKEPTAPPQHGPNQMSWFQSWHNSVPSLFTELPEYTSDHNTLFRFASKRQLKKTAKKRERIAKKKRDRQPDLASLVYRENYINKRLLDDPDAERIEPVIVTEIQPPHNGRNHIPGQLQQRTKELPHQ